MKRCLAGLAGWLANVSKRFILVREGQRQRARQPSQATPPIYPSPETWSWRHFCPYTYPERDFYPSIFRVFCTLFDAILICICQCTWPHKIPTFSRGPPIFAPARHQSATQTAPKPAPKLRAYTRFFALFVHFRTRAPPKRDTNRAKTRSEPLRSFACFCHFCIRSAPKRAADRASHPFATKAHRRPRQNPIRSSALGQRLRSRSCPRGVLSISPGGGVLCITKDR